MKCLMSYKTFIPCLDKSLKPSDPSADVFLFDVSAPKGVSGRAISSGQANKHDMVRLEALKHQHVRRINPTHHWPLYLRKQLAFVQKTHVKL